MHAKPPAMNAMTLSSDAKTAVIAGAPLTTAVAADELLHPPAASGHYSATETSYFGFNIPKEAINGEIYLWFHPVLSVMSASVYIWRGLKSSTLACEYINHYHYLPMPGSNIDDYEIEALGLQIKVLEPLKVIEVTFNDPVRNVSFNLRSEAIMPAVQRPGGFHFTQAMRTRGELRLHGQTFNIDGFFSRDRSWGQERRETARPIAVTTWMAGVVDDNFAFHCSGTDSADTNPEWAKDYSIPEGRNLIWGYVWRDGEVFSVKTMKKRTTREIDGISPRLFELEIAEANGKTHALRGEVVARMPWQTWQNMNVFFSQVRWSTERGIGYGDAQDIQMNDFVRRYVRG
jgi:hypothetical protein